MTNSTFTSTASINAQSTQDFLITAGLIETVAFYQTKIEKSRRQLLLIQRNHSESDTGRQAEEYLVKQNKLVEIASELKSRMIDQIAKGEITKELEKQFTQEVDILNYMHFEVTKTFFSFINKNFEAKIISLRRPMAA